jgi:curved DNA-binding protein CbpA
MANPQNYYEILQVSQDATLQEIKIAFRRLARQYHPDLHPNQPTATEQFKKICQAYEILSDSQLRQQYNQEINIQFAQSNSEETNHFSQQDFYHRGNHKTQDKDFESAIADYNQAIENNPDFWQVYLKRAEAYYQLFKDSSVLEDCQTILRIKPNSEQAYYYLGLSRQRLGYTQSAIDAYSKAIQLEPNPPQFYQHRGLAYEEIENYSQAINDFRIAIRLFQRNREFNQIPTFQRKINNLSKKNKISQEQWIKNIFDSTFGIFLKFILASWLIVKHHKEGLLLAFMSLSKIQALLIGLFYGLIAVWIWNLILILPLFTKFILGLFPFILISFSSAMGRRLTRSYGYLAGDIFLGGFTSLLISIVFYLNLSRIQLPEIVLLILTFILISYIGYSLKNGYTQISNLPAKLAVFLAISVLSSMVYSLIVW